MWVCGAPWRQNYDVMTFANPAATTSRTHTFADAGAATRDERRLLL